MLEGYISTGYKLAELKRCRVLPEVGNHAGPAQRSPCEPPPRLWTNCRGADTLPAYAWGLKNDTLNCLCYQHCYRLLSCISDSSIKLEGLLKAQKAAFNLSMLLINRNLCSLSLARNQRCILHSQNTTIQSGYQAVNKQPSSPIETSALKHAVVLQLSQEAECSRAAGQRMQSSLQLMQSARSAAALLLCRVAAASSLAGRANEGVPRCRSHTPASCCSPTS